MAFEKGFETTRQGLQRLVRIDWFFPLSIKKSLHFFQPLDNHIRKIKLRICLLNNTLYFAYFIQCSALIVRRPNLDGVVSSQIARCRSALTGSDDG